VVALVTEDSPLKLRRSARLSVMVQEVADDNGMVYLCSTIDNKVIKWRSSIPCRFVDFVVVIISIREREIGSVGAKGRRLYI
jgi:hypothetical protein